MKLDVKKDRKEINKIIENILPLMKLNKNLTQECADCIIVYFIEKKDTSNSTLPADSKSRTHRKRDDKYFEGLNG